MIFFEDDHLEESIPDPELLIKSIAEQGYSLETSLADLIDNSIVAGADKIEVLVNTNEEPFVLFISDNGNGMNEAELKNNMKLPSYSLEAKREKNDLGRFGLGMKTASFAQTRCLTVISRKKGELQYKARTWDVAYLKQERKWKVITNTPKEVDDYIASYKKLSNDYINSFTNFTANTIIVWKGLYKFEDFIDNQHRGDSLKKELTEVTADYLSLVFHRFMERSKDSLKIRINNSILSPFNPFPIQETDIRPIEYKQRTFKSEVIKIEGFVLPARSIDESKSGVNKWTTKSKSLMDMEGIYLYRANRLILFGGWNGLIKKTSKLQLARLRVEVGNSVDGLLHLNVAKSQLAIPYELKQTFLRYLIDLKTEAEKEFHNRGINGISYSNKSDNSHLFLRKPSNKGVLLTINYDFPLLVKLKNELKPDQFSSLKIIIRMVNTTINKIRNVYQEQGITVEDTSEQIETVDLIWMIEELGKSNISRNQIRDIILPLVGFNLETLPEEVKLLLKDAK